MVGASFDHHAVVERLFDLEPHDDVRKAWLRYLERRADALVEDHRAEIEAVAEALLEHRALTATEVTSVIRDSI